MFANILPVCVDLLAFRPISKRHRTHTHSVSSARSLPILSRHLRGIVLLTRLLVPKWCVFNILSLMETKVMTRKTQILEHSFGRKGNVLFISSSSFFFAGVVVVSSFPLCHFQRLNASFARLCRQSVYICVNWQHDMRFVPNQKVSQFRRIFFAFRFCQIVRISSGFCCCRRRRRQQQHRRTLYTMWMNRFFFGGFISLTCLNGKHVIPKQICSDYHMCDTNGEIGFFFVRYSLGGLQCKQSSMAWIRPGFSPLIIQMPKWPWSNESRQEKQITKVINPRLKWFGYFSNRVARAEKQNRWTIEWRPTEKKYVGHM